MILNFSNTITRDIFDGTHSKKTRKVPMDLHDKARRLFDQLNASTHIDEMRTPPGNMLESLSGNLSGYWSVRLNRQWRILFKWDEQQANASDVYIDDYH